MLLLAHVSDLHLGQDRKDGGARAQARAEQVMAYLEGLPGELDALLVSGDIADHGAPEEYADAARILTSRHRVLTCPGNHDDRAAYREHLLGAAPAPGPVNQVHELPGATVLMCDSTIPGQDDGRLDEETLDWLEAELGARPDTPTLVSFHHPPVVLHAPFVDRIRLAEPERLTELLDRHRQVVGVLCGHAHTPAASTFAGRPLLVAPGVVSTVTLRWEGEEGITFDHPPMLAFHILDDQGRLTTHYRVVA